MKWLTLVCLVPLSGCVAGLAGNDANIYGSPLGQRVVGNEMYVTVSNVWNEMDALPLAEAHCKKFGKSARARTTEAPKVIFDCVTQ